MESCLISISQELFFTHNGTWQCKVGQLYNKVIAMLCAVQNSKNKKKEKRTKPKKKKYTTVDPKQLHKSNMKFCRQTQNTDTASQPTWEASWETRPETRERQNQGGGHGIPANVGDKTGNKRKQRPGRRTQHPSQGKHT